MDEKELSQLYDRLNNLPEAYQSFVLARIHGALSFHVKQGNETALELIKEIEESVKSWEGRLNGHPRSLSS